MDSYDDSRKRDKHRSSEHKKSKSHHKSQKQIINEYLSDNSHTSEYNEMSYEGSSYKRSRSRSRSRDRHHSSKHHKHHKHSSAEKSLKQEDSYYIEPMKHYAGTPSATVMMRQLPLYIGESDLRNELITRNVPFKECRLVKSRETGASRGFGFVEFNSIEEAQGWLESLQGYMIMYDTKVHLYYSQPKFDDDERFKRRQLNPFSTDWDCFKCGIKNFKRRDCCFKCNTSREDSEKMREGEGYEHVGTTPCNTLILRGLDALSTDETIRYSIAQLTNVYAKNIHIARDTLTNISNGFAFIEFNSIQEASSVLSLLQNVKPVFELDGKQINVDYCKNNYSTAITQLGSKISYPLPHNNYDPTSYKESRSYTANRTKTNQADQANSAAAVAQAALKSMQKKQVIIHHLTSSLTGDSSATSAAKNGVQSIKAYVTPDVSTYTYDEVSGYYYDSITGFYYDANSQYYYNSMTQQYMYWDLASFSYIVVSNDQSSASAVGSATDTSSYYPYATSAAVTSEPAAVENTTTAEVSDVAPTEKNDPKKAKISNAAQIAKNMEKWAVTMNKKKVAFKKQQPTTVTSTPTTTSASSASPTIPTVSNFINSNTDANNKKESTVTTSATGTTTATPVAMETASTAEVAQDVSTLSKKVFESHKIEQPPTQETNEDLQRSKEAFDEKKFLDFNKLACLLCKRGFDSADLLNKHIQMSTLHKNNLEKYKQENQVSVEKKDDTSDSVLAAIQYRDRAKERRDKYGVPEPPFKSDVRERLGIDTYPPTSDYSYSSKETSSSSDTVKDSIGSKLMRKMGWSEGSGLGKKNQGISAPIEASVRQRGLGLGASGADYDPNDSYKECVRKSARARFEQLNS